MKLHRIVANSDYLKQVFGNGVRFFKVTDGLSDDAELLYVGKVNDTLAYEFIFKASSGVEVSEGEIIIDSNPTMHDLRYHL